MYAPTATRSSSVLKVLMITSEQSMEALRRKSREEVHLKRITQSSLRSFFLLGLLKVRWSRCHLTFMRVESMRSSRRQSGSEATRASSTRSLLSARGSPRLSPRRSRRNSTTSITSARRSNTRMETVLPLMKSMTESLSSYLSIWLGEILSLTMYLLVIIYLSTKWK